MELKERVLEKSLIIFKVLCLFYGKKGSDYENVFSW